MKNEMVIRINSVGIASNKRRSINLSIALTLCDSLMTAYYSQHGPAACAAGSYHINA